MRIGAAAAVAGALGQLVATVHEPDSSGEPSDAVQVIADSGVFTADRLIDLIGVLLTVGALTVVYRTFGEGAGRDWARVGQPFLVLMGALGSAAVVSGANMKELADSWADASSPEKQSYLASFDAARGLTDDLFFAAFLALGVTGFLMVRGLWMRSDRELALREASIDEKPAPAPPMPQVEAPPNEALPSKKGLMPEEVIVASPVEDGEAIGIVFNVEVPLPEERWAEDVRKLEADLRTRFDHAAEDAHEHDLAAFVHRDLERERSERLVVLRRARQLLARVARIDAGHRRHVRGRRQVIDNGVEQRMDALVAQRRAREHWDHLHRDRRLANDRLDLGLGDFLALDREIERVLEGELLAVGTAGAYGFSMASNYNARPRPGEVLVGGDRYTLIRKRETQEDLVRGEIELLD